MRQAPTILVSVLSQYKLPLHAVVVLVIALICLWPAVWAGQQMLLHIVMMTVLAPAAVYVLEGVFPRHRIISVRWLWLTTVLQTGVFLFWHTPFGMGIAMQAADGEHLIQFSLLVTATLFWWSLLHLRTGQTWHAILALLMTGKLFCLVALLLTFAPRALYPMMSLADQQLAGLIMITLCPLCYVAAAIWLCWQWLGLIEDEGSEWLRGESCA